MQDAITDSSQLRRASVSSYVTLGHTGLTEVRDLTEAQTLGAALDLINRRRLEQAMDLLTMRLAALSKAKAKGGTWEKAQRVELIPEPGNDGMPSGLATLLA